MGSSGEEDEMISGVTDYYFVNNEEEPVSFSLLPLKWGREDITLEDCPDIYLRGVTDSSLRNVYKKVLAWNLELSFMTPDILVMFKDQIWIKLRKPRRSYEEKFKSTLVLVQFLHSLKQNPLGCRDTIWNPVLKALRKFEDPPSEKDLVDYIPLIQQVSLRDAEIAKSEYLASFLLGMHDTAKAAVEESQAPKKHIFLNDGDEDDCGEDDEEEEEIFDSVCAFCDDGGELLCCEGRCMRSFHPTPESGDHSLCETLGFSREQTDAIKCFRCKNCQFQMHQCFVCGLLGSSNKSTSTDVFPCVSATCGHFYHPKCVSKLLNPDDVVKAGVLESEIASGGSFVCPIHTCNVCKQVEDRKVHELQFAICRRCPKSYHRKCLPSAIRFERAEEKKAPRRAWEGLLPNRILIYCKDHGIFCKTGTPRRDHLAFPIVTINKGPSDSESFEVTVGAEKRSKKHGVLLDQKPVAEVTRSIKNLCTSGVSISPKKRLKVRGLHQVCRSNRGQFSSSYVDNRMPPNQKDKYSAGKRRMPNQYDDQSKSIGVVAIPSPSDTDSSQTSENAEIKKKVLELIKSTDALFDEEEFLRDRERPKTYDVKKITMGKINTSVEAIQAALKILENGGSTEDAKAVCPPEIITQLSQWKRKLGVYLAPFLHGTRYTSYGRHFTKIEKLQEIVDRLRWYVNDGDTIVDFCCGSNDFSWLMNEALDRMGKKCSFKNYDLIQSKNDFNFEKRNWLEVQVGDLPSGSNLIMGLNPPFGVHASKANQFINKALEFNPKLVILIVPEETTRLEDKKVPYELIWEDKQLLSGKSFYLPGSIDENGKQVEQWNVLAPPLYLWSRPDWAAYHRAIAMEQGHIQDMGSSSSAQPCEDEDYPSLEDLEFLF